MKQYSVYILRCSDGAFYTGVCNDLERRISEHENGEDRAAYTYKRRPVTLIYNEQFDDINQAIEREKQIKGWSRAKKKALIDEEFDKLILLSKNTRHRVILRQAQDDRQIRNHTNFYA